MTETPTEAPERATIKAATSLAWTGKSGLMAYLRESPSLIGTRRQSGKLESPYEQIAWVYACVRIIKDSLTTSRLRFRQDEDPKSDLLPATHPICQLFKRPNRWMTQRQYLEHLAMYLMLAGEGIHLFTDRRGRMVPVGPDPDAKMPTPSEFWLRRGGLSLARLKRDKAGYPDAWEFGDDAQRRQYRYNATLPVVLPHERIPLRGMTPLEPLIGSSETLVLGELLLRTQFENGGESSPIVSFPGKLDTDQRRKAEEILSQEWADASRAGRPRVLENDAKVHAIGKSVRELGLRELSTLTKKDISAALGPSDALLGMGTSNYATFQGETLTFWKTTMLPLQARILDAINQGFIANLRDERLASNAYAFFDNTAVEALQPNFEQMGKNARSLIAVGVPPKAARETVGLGDMPETEVDEEVFLTGDLKPAREILASGVPTQGEDVNPLEVAATEEAGIGQRLNGAQVASLLEVVEQVSLGVIPKPAAVELLVEAFKLPREVVNRILASVEEGGAIVADEAVDDAKVAISEYTKGFEETRDEVYSAWRSARNMSASELRRWSESECSRKASVSPGKVIARNLELLETPKADWGRRHVRNANRAISFIARMRGAEQGKPVSDDCPSKRDISLRNWGYNPSKAKMASGGLINPGPVFVPMPSQRDAGNQVIASVLGSEPIVPSVERAKAAQGVQAPVQAQVEAVGVARNVSTREDREQYHQQEERRRESGDDRIGRAIRRVNRRMRKAQLEHLERLATAAPAIPIQRSGQMLRAPMGAVALGQYRKAMERDGQERMLLIDRTCCGHIERQRRAPFGKSLLEATEGDVLGAIRGRSAVKAADANMTDAQIAALLVVEDEKWLQEIVDELEPVMLAVAAEGITNAADEVELAPLLDVPPSMAQLTRDNVVTLAGDVQRTLATHVEAALVDAIAEAGATTGTVQGRVLQALGPLKEATAEQFRQANTRSLAIARTETSFLDNRAKYLMHLTARDRGEMLSHEWVASSLQSPPSGRTRASHVQADGQVVPIGQAFSVGSANLLHPGDKSTGALGEFINCRCSLRGRRLQRDLQDGLIDQETFDRLEFGEDPA